MINNITPRTAKPDALTSLLRSDLPDLGEILVSRVAPSNERPSEADTLTLYMNQAARWSRLGAEEELQLGRKIKAGKDAAGNLTAEAQTAFAELVNRNLRLPYHAAQQMRVPREELLDLISAGNAALLDAARDFNADLGHRFSTYAFWGIRSAVMRELNFLRRTVRLPRNLHEQLSKLRKAEAALLRNSAASRKKRRSPSPSPARRRRSPSSAATSGTASRSMRRSAKKARRASARPSRTARPARRPTTPRPRTAWMRYAKSWPS